MPLQSESKTLNKLNMNILKWDLKKRLPVAYEAAKLFAFY